VLLTSQSNNPLNSSSFIKVDSVPDSTRPNAFRNIDDDDGLHACVASLPHLHPSVIPHLLSRWRADTRLVPKGTLLWIRVVVWLDPLALCEGLPEGLDDAAAVGVVGVAEQGHDGLGGLLSVVLRNATEDQVRENSYRSIESKDLREQVVDDVVVSDVVEHVLSNKAIVAINSSQSTLDERPGLGHVLG